MDTIKHPILQQGEELVAAIKASGTTAEVYRALNKATNLVEAIDKLIIDNNIQVPDIEIAITLPPDTMKAMDNYCEINNLTRDEFIANALRSYSQ